MSTLGQAWVDAWNSHDPDTVAALFAEDATVDFMGGGPQFAVKGLDAIKESVRAYQGWTNDGSFTLVSELVREDRFVIEFVETATNTGKMRRQAPATNRRYTCPGVAVGRLDSNGKITEERDYMDRVDLFVQLGILTDPLS